MLKNCTSTGKTSNFLNYLRVIISTNSWKSILLSLLVSHILIRSWISVSSTFWPRFNKAFFSSLKVHSAQKICIEDKHFFNEISCTNHYLVCKKIFRRKEYYIFFCWMYFCFFLSLPQKYPQPQFSNYKHCAVMNPSPAVSICLKICSSPGVSCLLSLAPIGFKFINTFVNRWLISSTTN